MSAAHRTSRPVPSAVAPQTARVGARAVCPAADLRLQRIAEAAARAAMNARATASPLIAPRH